MTRAPYQLTALAAMLLLPGVAAAQAGGQVDPIAVSVAASGPPIGPNIPGQSSMAHQSAATPKAKVKLVPKATGWHKTNLVAKVPAEWIRDNPGNWVAHDNGINGDGAMRTVCGFSHMAYDDPVVYPGEKGRSHLHTFFGNTGTTYKSTSKTIQTSGNSTCRGGTGNRSAYWVPTMIDRAVNAALKPDSIVTYYKTAGSYWPLINDLIVPLPKGLRLVFGNTTNTDPSKTRGYFECWGPNGEQWERSGEINCREGTAEVLQVLGAPLCWDGKNLDSPDHKSHVVDPVQNQDWWEKTLADGRKVPGFWMYCPESHPKTIPGVSYNIHYKVPQNPDGTYKSTRTWALSCDLGDTRGTCNHGDLMEGWKDEVRAEWNEHCLGTNGPGKMRRDGHAHLLCGGSYLGGRP